MADEFTPEQWQQIDEQMAKGAFSPKQMELLTRLRQQRTVPAAGTEAAAPATPEPLTPAARLEPELPAPGAEEGAWPAAVRGVWDWGKSLVTGTATALESPEDSKPWWERIVEGVAETPGEFSTSPPLKLPAGTSPETTAKAWGQYEQGIRSGAREALEWLPTIIAAVYGPVSAAAGAYKGLAALYNQVGQPLLRAAYMYLGQNAAERVANIVDPSQRTDPDSAALSEATGELLGGLGGRIVDRTGKGLNMIRQKAFGETTEGAMRRAVIEGVGEHPTPAMVSEQYWPRATDAILANTPFGGRMRERYASVHKALQGELERHSSLHPGSRVTERSQPLLADVEAASTPAILHSGPRVLRTTRDAMIEQVNKNLDDVYGQLDTDYLTRPLNWGAAKPKLPQLYGMQDLLLDPGLLPQVGTGSLFHDVLRMNHALLQQQDTISLASAYDMLKMVRAKTAEVYEQIHLGDALLKADPTRDMRLTDSLQKKVLPELGKMEDQLNQLVRPYLVDMTAAKAKARTLVTNWDEAHPGQLQMTQASLQGGQAGRIAVLEDPHIQAARGLLKQPDFMTFMDAHQARAKLYQVSRQEGPLIDNVIATHGQELGDLVDTSMTATANRLTPDLAPRWRDANTMYREAKEIYDSRLMHEFKDMNLDDILTKLVKTQRPNDMATLRYALGTNPAGADTFDTAAQMWLTREIEEARRIGGAKGMDYAHLAKNLGQVDAETERVLFPRGELTAVKNKLERVQLMETAVDEASQGGKVDALKLATYKSALSGAEWQSVQSDVLAHMFSGGTDPISGKKLLDGLNKLHHANAAGVLFQPQHLAELQHLAHTARYIEDAALSGSLHWNPLVRMGEHVMGPAGAGGVGLVLHLATHNPALTAAGVAGWLISAPAAAWLMTNPTAVRWLTQGMSPSITAEHAGEIVGMILAQLNNGGYQEAVTPLKAGDPALQVGGKSAASPAAATPR